MTSKYKVPPGYDPQKDKIEIVEYDPRWPELYFQEEARLQKVLKEIPQFHIEHFGSTSVPGLGAKPIIDIMIAVESRDFWPILIEPIKTLGYNHWEDNPKKDEMFFVKGMPPFGEKRTHHIHVLDFQGFRWKRERLFRDYLRVHIDEARKYEVLKRKLSVKFSTDREAYTEAKTEFINSIHSQIPG